MANRERLSSRLGFILLSAGCAIGCGNVWAFPWRASENGGGAFVFVYILCLIFLGLPVMTMEFSLGRAAQASPVKMYQKLQKPGQKWHIHGGLALFGNICLMSFYTVVAGWILYYFVQFLSGNSATLDFGNTVASAPVNMGYMGIVIVAGFAVLCFKLQGGLERVTKYMMVALLFLMVGLAIYSCTLDGAKAGLDFYLVPKFEEITPRVVVDAMNQAFFSLSLGIGSMAIFGSYIGKDRSLMGESVNVIVLDSFVAIAAGLIIFPACTTYGITLEKPGPGILFTAMTTAFNAMGPVAGRIMGTLFYLFMVFAAFSTVLAVFENILACVREITGWSRIKGAIICGIVLFLTSSTTALGGSLLSGFQPFGPESGVLDLWDFIVSTNLLPIGSLIFVIFCTFKRFGFGWKKFIAEANSGKGLKVRNWMMPFFCIIPPIAIIVVYITGLIDKFK